MSRRFWRVFVIIAAIGFLGWAVSSLYVWLTAFNVPKPVGRPSYKASEVERLLNEGRIDEAIEAYESLPHLPLSDLSLRIAGIYERRGELRKALRIYACLRVFAGSGDEELRSIGERAKEGFERVRRLTGRP